MPQLARPSVSGLSPGPRLKGNTAKSSPATLLALRLERITGEPAGAWRLGQEPRTT